MIVVDTHVIAYFYLPTTYTPQAEQLYLIDPVWVAPALWRSEMRNVLALYIRKKLITFEDAARIQAEAEFMMKENEYEINSLDVLKLVRDSELSAYDCEFVALAKNLGVKLATLDKKILKSYPDITFKLKDV